MGLAPATKFKPHNHKMAVSRVYMCAPGINPPDAPRIERGDTAVGVVTAEGPVRKLPLTLNRACFLKGDQCAATRVDLIGEPPGAVAEAQAECERLLGPHYFAKEAPFLVPERPVVLEAERILLDAISSVRSPWERSKIHVERPEAASAGPPKATAARAGAPASPAGSPPTEPPPAIPESSAVPLSGTTQSPVPDRRPRALELARAHLRLDRELEGLRQRRAKAEKNPNKIVRRKLLAGIDKQIALLDAGGNPT